MNEVLDLRNEQTDSSPEQGEESFASTPETPQYNAEDIVAWNAPKIHHELISHTLRKVIIVSMFAVALLTIIWQKNFFTAFTFILIGIITSLHFKKEHAPGEYVIHPEGIVVNSSIYGYQEFESFCIHHNHNGLKELSLHHKKRIFPHIKIPLGTQKPEDIRLALSNNLLEDYHEHGIDDYLRIKLGL